MRTKELLYHAFSSQQKTDLAIVDGRTRFVACGVTIMKGKTMKTAGIDFIVKKKVKENLWFCLFEITTNNFFQRIAESEKFFETVKIAPMPCLVTKKGQLITPHFFEKNEEGTFPVDLAIYGSLYELGSEITKTSILTFNNDTLFRQTDLTILSYPKRLHLWSLLKKSSPWFSFLPKESEICFPEHDIDVYETETESIKKETILPQTDKTDIFKLIELLNSEKASKTFARYKNPLIPELEV